VTAASSGLPDVLAVEPVHGGLDAVVRPPGSKSLTNRALVCAALAHGDTALRGVLYADDTEAMLSCLHELGIGLRLDRAAPAVAVTGSGGAPPAEGALMDARLSGTTSRFVLPVAALGRGTMVLDGAAPLRARPMTDLLDALTSLGAEWEPLGDPGHLPVRLEAGGLAGGTVRVRGDVSSQFLSGLLLSAPCMRDGLVVEVSTQLVSVPYVDMTLAVMSSFGASHRTEVGPDGRRVITVDPGGYRSPGGYDVEPDASAASYFFAAAAICGGTVRVEGLGSGSLQGDVAFVDALEQMGATVERGSDHLSVTGGAALRGVDVDFADLSDTAQTLAVVAPFASSPTTISGIGFIRAKETDRIAAVVTELRRCGIDAEELPDGIRVHPGEPRPATVATYDDHRMAMSFALLGLRAPGISIADPGCVAKTFPGYWAALEDLRRSGRS
jgi:3-phosphoshikimate 1-carboxyvinyltransferase